MTTTIAFFNNKGGVGRTTLAYHLAHMFSRLDSRVLAVDLDPQADLTAHCLDDATLENLWGGSELLGRKTIGGAVEPIIQGSGDVSAVDPLRIDENFYLLAGDLGLSRFEELLAQAWPVTLANSGEAAARTTTAFHRLVTQAADLVGADIVLVDVGPDLGALSRSALLLAHHVVIPVAADPCSIQALRYLGPALRRWRAEWQSTALPRFDPVISAPAGRMAPLGYVVMRSGGHSDRPVKAQQTWLERIPALYADAVLDQEERAGDHRIGTVRNYRSLMPLAHDARKPMFDLRPADGAIGSTLSYVGLCRQEFRALAEEILRRLDAAADA